MELTFKERRQHQQTLKRTTKALKEGGLSFKEKRSIQSAQTAAIKALKGVVKAVSDVVADLIAGRFNQLAPAKFREKLVEVSQLDHDFNAVRDATSKYLELHFEGSTLLESLASEEMSEDAELAALVREREGGKTVKVSINDL